MSQIMIQIEHEIKEIVLKAVGQAVAEQELPAEPMPSFQIAIPNDRAHGDYAINAAMVSAKAFRLPPRKIAECIASRLDFTGTYLSRAEIAGPGFINFFLDDRLYGEILKDIEDKKEKYGASDYGKGETYMVEFVSANPTGPMHIGNARGGALGDCLAAVLSFAGYTVTKEFYINDAGNQIEKFASSLNARYLQIYKEETPFPEDGYHGGDIIARAKEFAEQNGDQYMETGEEERKAALVAYALPLNIENLRKDLLEYRVPYDVWFRESSLYESGELDQIIEVLKTKGWTYEKEDALWYKATEFGGEKDEVLIRANGNPTYFAADIAYHYNKFVKRGFQKVINIWGADHHGHVARLKGAMDALGIDSSRLEVVIMQMVRLVQSGEVVKVSKRTGKSITLKTLLEDVPVDAARFFFNLREPSTHLEFDLDLAVEQSSQNPVYYVQYAHARICSIVKNLENAGVVYVPCTVEQLQLLSTSEEKELIRHLSLLTGEIIDAARERNPALITRYAIELATLFHKFYNACQVKGDNPELTRARLTLCICARTVLQNVLKIIKIDAPESM